MRTVVYRSGIVKAPESRGCELGSYQVADSVKPEGRQGRACGIFASPTIEGVLRWVRANAMMPSIVDPFVRELKVDSNTVYVYCVRTWERCSSRNGNYEEYWNTGLTLSNWLKNSEDYDPEEWELLLAPEDILSQKNVSDNRMVKVAEKDDVIYSDLSRLLKESRRKFKQLGSSMFI